MNSIEEYQNLIEFLKNILSFYANENNYKLINDIKMIDSDENGSQARFALKRIKDIENSYDISIKEIENNFLNNDKE